MSARVLLALTAYLTLSLLPATVQARVVRYALLVGANRGSSDDPLLRYAERDASRVRDVLLSLSGYLPENTLLISQPDAASVRRALISLNERIRRDISQPDTQAVLLVYYSGHADAEALHLGAAALELRELSGLVNGSAAQFRLLLLDACRSGAVTRQKGGRPVPAFTVALSERLTGEGAVFLTSSAASEDAQESDELRGSFFTHYFLSGLMGAADADRDGQVSLSEVYKYAYGHTLRATSKSWAGTQHPTFRYQLEGRGDFPMSFPREYARERAELMFPAGRSYLVLRGDAEGSVVGEIGRDDQVRSLSVESGHYFIRGREPEALLEGALDAAAGARVDVGAIALDRVEYARLARKGGSARRLTHGPELGYRVRTPLWKNSAACQGLQLAYPIEFAAISFSPRLAGCLSAFENAYVRAHTQELALELRAARAWDLGSRFSVDLGVSLGAQLVTQQFDSRGSAPARTSLAGAIGVGPGLKVALLGGLHAFAELSVLTQLLERRDRERQQLTAAPALAVSAGLGQYF
jgi:hypothetical protein